MWTGAGACRARNERSISPISGLTLAEPSSNLLVNVAAAEQINESYVCRVLRLTLLSPELTESILDGRQRATLDVRDLLKPFPTDWPSQAARFGCYSACNFDPLSGGIGVQN